MIVGIPTIGLYRLWLFFIGASTIVPASTPDGPRVAERCLYGSPRVNSGRAKTIANDVNYNQMLDR